ncbi:hypothetical protein [Streptomyces sp. NRRL S-350]|uniref:hypothetical protein n=1 Tax=Streptomyces sp. NRRL S-350 TaxID=1463902 RepID=UPI0004BEAD34|nr:hypothetical protein [Streptomyces sp. NRRL S-350]
MNINLAAETARFMARVADDRRTGKASPSERLALRNGAVFLRDFANLIEETIDLGPIVIGNAQAMEAFSAALRTLTSELAGEAAFPEAMFATVLLTLGLL